MRIGWSVLFATVLLTLFVSRLSAGEEEASQTGWENFGVGSWIIVERRLIEPAQARPQRRRTKFELTDIGNGRTRLVGYLERRGAWFRDSSPTPGRSLEELGMRPTGTRRESLRIGRRSIACTVTVYSASYPKGNKELSLWRAEDVRVPHRKLRSGGGLVLSPNVVRAEYKYTGTSKHAVVRASVANTSTQVVESFDEQLTVGGRKVRCVTESSIFRNARDSREETQRRWLSREVPGHTVKVESTSKWRGQLSSRWELVVVDFRAISKQEAAAAAAREAAAFAAHAESLKRALRAFYAGMAAKTEKKRRAALDALLPRRNDLETLFPGRGERLWTMMSPGLDDLRGRTAEIARDFSGRVVSIEVIDVRREKTYGRPRSALAMIPEDIPVYRAVTRRGRVRASGSSSYLFVNGRWIFIQDLEAIPQILDELREKTPAEKPAVASPTPPTSRRGRPSRVAPAAALTPEEARRRWEAMHLKDKAPPPSRPRPKRDTPAEPRKKTPTKKPAAADSHAESLKRALSAFYAGMAAKTEKKRRAALDAILPTREDMETLFAGRGERLWTVMGPAFDGLRGHTAELSRELGGRVLSIEVIDVRREDSSGRFRAVLAMIPRDVPVYRAITRRERGTAGSSSYLFVNGRWIWIRGLEAIPRALAAPRKRGR